MRFLRNTILLSFIFSSLFSSAQNVTVSGAVTGNGNYASLSAAFTAIAGSQTGANITITINASFTEVASATLGNNTWTSVSITPSGGAWTITSSFTPLLEFNGADYVTVDGLNSGGNSLTLDCSSTSNTASTVRFINDATHNIVTNCTLKGSATGVAGNSTDGAVVWFATTNSTSGNDYNMVSSCDIGPSGSNLPYMGIRSWGSGSTKSNDYNTIDKCTIHDFFQGNVSGSVNTNGLYILNYNSNWTITNNKIYQTASRTFTSGGQAVYRGIRISTSADANSGGFTVSNNVIGYQNSSGTGTTSIDLSGNLAVEFEAIIVQTGSSGSSSTISGNTVAGISFVSARAPTSSGGLQSQPFVGIYTDAGSATISNNTIGSSSGTGSIIIQSRQASDATVPCIVGILAGGSATQTITGNTIGGFSISKHPSAPASFGKSMIFSGIKYEGSAATSISSNTIGNTTSGNITSDQSAGNLYGFYNTNTAGALTFSSNTIQNFSHSGTSAGIIGIYSSGSGGSATASSNTIQNLVHTAANTGAGTSASVIGIFCNGSAGTYSLSQNKILSCANSSAGNTSVYGILANQTGSGHSISRNLIYALGVNASSPSGTVSGVRVAAGTATVSNNMVSLGYTISNNPVISALEIQGGNPSLYYNTFVVTSNGSVSGSASNTYALNVQNGSASYEVKDNILWNDRVTTNSNINVAVYFSSAAQVSNVSSEDYNDLYIGATNTILTNVGGTTYSNLGAWQGSGYGFDANSKSASATFNNIANDLHISSANCNLTGAGTTIAITIDYDNETRLSPPDIGADQVATTTTWTGTVSTDWNVATNWNFGLVPIASSDVVIPSGTPFPPNISTADANCRSLTINNGATLTVSNNHLLTLNATCANGNFTNNGTFNAGNSSEEVVFAGSTPNTITIGGTSSTTFNKLTLNIGAVISTSPTITKQLQINTNSYVTQPVTFTSTSTLVYNSGGSYNVNSEWTGSTTTVGYGTPQNVTIQNTTTLNLPNSNRGMAGNLNINSGTLNFNGTSGDLYIAGNWTRNGINGFFNPNCRAVFFTSTTTDQTISVSGGGTETFNYVIVDKSGKKLLIGASTNMTVSATSGCGLGNDYLTISNGDIDLQGRTLTLQGPTGLPGGTSVMNLKVKNGTRSILSSSAGGIVSLTSTLNCKTVLIADGGGSGKLLFGNNVEVKDATGEIDFGTGNLGTINYILRINSGGAVVGNAPYYADGSKLIFSTGTNYDIVSTQQVWETGTLSSTPGVPYDVDVNLANTDVRVSDNLDRCVRNNFSILAGTFELGAPGFLTGNLTVGGNWLRNTAGTGFVPNQNKVTFNSSVNIATQLQTLTMSSGGNESFYDLEENNALGLTLGTSTNAYVTNHLYLTSGLFSTGTNEVYVTNNAPAAITFDASNNSADSWINGYLRRKITTGTYDFPVGDIFSASAAGYELMSLAFSSNSNIDNLRVSFTIDASTQNEPYNVQVNGTWIGDRLNAGWWTVQPYDAALALVASPNCNYNVFLNERGHTNSQLDPQQYAVIKRDASYCYDNCGTSWGQCGVHTNSTQWEANGTAHAERSGYTCNSFSDWAIGFAPVILPIEITTFAVTSNNSDAFLTWLTSAEYNSDYFGVERSTDAVNFRQIGVVNAAGSSSSPKNYSFTDFGVKELGTSIIYYRLRMVDLDQTYQYSEVRAVNLNDGSDDDAVIVYPNPFTDQLNILWNSPVDAFASIQLADVAGRILIEKNTPVSAGANLISLDQLPSLADGVYFIHIISGKERLTQKVVREK